MAKVFVYDNYTNKFYTYTLSESDPMPYSSGNTLRVREFRGSSKSSVLWTTVAAMEAWNLTRRNYGSGIPVGYAFKRIWEGGHGTTSQHYAGVAFDVGQSLSSTARRKIYNTAVATGAWGYVEPLSMTPTWVHFDRRYARLPQHHRRLPHRQAGQPQHLCTDPAGRPERPGLFHRFAGRHLRFRHRKRPQGHPEEFFPDGGRCLWVQQLEKDRLRGGGHRPHLHRH